MAFHCIKVFLKHCVSCYGWPLPHLPNGVYLWYLILLSMLLLALVVVIYPSTRDTTAQLISDVCPNVATYTEPTLQLVMNERFFHHSRVMLVLM